jgi:NAD+ synthase
MELEMPEGIRIDPSKVKNHLIRFIKNELEKTGFSRLVLGVSGGVDSTVVAFLSAESIGSDNVTGVILPHSESNRDSINDAEQVIKHLGINRRFVDISSMIDAYFKYYPTTDRTRRGNKIARERMSILYDISAELKALVIGTSNKSEILMGYGTIFGDLACALNPLGNLYKSQVRQLAFYLRVSTQIIAKPPSADLWKGQTDESELGLTYEMLDAFLYYLVEQNYTDKMLLEKGFSSDFIKTVKDKISKNEFKRSMPKIADLPG